MFDEIKSYSAMEWAKFLLIIALVLLIGLFAVNQFLNFRYKAELFSTPCELCLELNKNVDLCPRTFGIDPYNPEIIITPDPPVELKPFPKLNE